MPKARTNPPTTAINLVDFFRQNQVNKGDNTNEVAIDVATKHPTVQREKDS